MPNSGKLPTHLTDQELGMDRPITRPDFLNGLLWFLAIQNLHSS
jgi:hypothetical protein